MTPLETDTRSFDLLYQHMGQIVEEYCTSQSPELDFDWEGDEVVLFDYDDKGKEHAEEIMKNLENADLIAGTKPSFYEEVDKENKNNLKYLIGVLRLDS